MTPRRSPGEVRDAIVEFFSANAKREVTTAEINASVNQSLRGEVAPSSIRSYLQKLDGAGRVKRVARGRYKWTGR